MTLRFLVIFLITLNIFVFSGKDKIKNFLFVPPVQNKALVKGIKDINIGDASFKKEIYYALPGFYSLDDQLKQLGVSLGAKDKIMMIPAPDLGVGGRIEITRANQIKLIDAKTQKTIATWATTVEDFITENKITLDKTDKIKPGLSSAITSGDTIQITRIGIKEEKETEEIDFAESVKVDNQKDVCSLDVIKGGSKGILTKFFKVTYENGEEVARTKVSEEVTKKPVDRLIIKGGKVEVLGAGKATWYNWRPGEAAHNTLPKGTLVKVTNLANNKSTIVRITDRGIHRSDVVIDLDARSFKAIGALWQGVLQVRLEKACE